MEAESKHWLYLLYLCSTETEQRGRLLYSRRTDGKKKMLITFYYGKLTVSFSLCACFIHSLRFFWKAHVYLWLVRWPASVSLRKNGNPTEWKTTQETLYILRRERGSERGMEKCEQNDPHCAVVGSRCSSRKLRLTRVWKMNVLHWHKAQCRQKREKQTVVNLLWMKSGALLRSVAAVPLPSRIEISHATCNVSQWNAKSLCGAHVQLNKWFVLYSMRFNRWFSLCHPHAGSNRTGKKQSCLCKSVRIFFVLSLFMFRHWR